MNPLLDLGHLKVSAQLMGFQFTPAVNSLFNRYDNRIVELHLSENNGIIDDHLPISAGSIQYALSRENAAFIRQQGNTGYP